MKAKLKQLCTDSFIYGIGGILARGVSFFLLPIYTRIFTPAEYGIIETLTILNLFIGVVLLMGMDSAQSFYFFEQKESGKCAQTCVVTAVFQWRLIWGSVILILATSLSPLFNALFFSGKLSLDYFVIAFVSILFMHFMSQSAEVFRLLYRPYKYILITLGYAAMSSISALILVVWFKLGIKGHFIGFCIGAIIAAVFGWWTIRDYLDFSKLHREWWPSLIRFGVPLIPGCLAMYALNSSDRWFIMYYCGQGALGIYAVGAKFVVLFSLAVEAFRQAWGPLAIDALNRSDGHELFRAVARLYLGLGAICVVIVTAVSPLLVKLISGPAYHSVYPIIGILSWQSIFYGFFLIAFAGIWKKKRTLWMSITMGIAVLINISLDIYFVPKFGGIGAAIATAISFFFWNIFTLIISERLWPINYPLGIFSLQIGIGVLGCTLILFIYKNNLPVWYAAAVVAITAAILVFTLVEFDKFIKIWQYMNLGLVGKDK